MAGLFDSARARAKEAAQTVLCQAGGLQRAVNDFNGKVNPFYTGSRGEEVTRRIERELSRFCPIPPAPSPQPNEPPVTGGQCPGVDYIFRLSWIINSDPSGTVQFTETGGYTGPQSSSSLGYFVDWNANFDRWQANWRQSNGVYTNQGLGGTLADGPGRTVVGREFRRVDGLPDTCGNPGPDYPPGVNPPTPSNPRPTLPDVDVDFPGFPPITIPLAPVVGIVNVNVDGKITVPVAVNASFDLGGQSFDIDFNFDVDLGNPDAEPTVPPVEPPLDPDDRPAPPDCPPPPSCAPADEEDEEPDEPPIDPEDPEDEKEQEIKSVRVMSVVNPERSPATEILMTGGAPNIFAPRIGSVKFVYAVVPGVVAWSTDIDVKASNQIIPAPKTGLRCLGAIFSPGAGVEGETFFTRGRRCDCD